jgi:hypothetical protein
MKTAALALAFAALCCCGCQTSHKTDNAAAKPAACAEGTCAAGEKKACCEGQAAQKDCCAKNAEAAKAK